MDSTKVRVIAIDGPAAAGKTVAARAVADRLGFACLDTGVMYRAVTWLALRESVSMEDEEALTALAVNSNIQVDRANPGFVMVGGTSLGPELRSPEIGNRVSLVARVSGVRSALVEQQRRLAEEGEVVMVGRDIGTVVLPGADMKIFIEASLEERAKRRWRESLGPSPSSSQAGVRPEPVEGDAFYQTVLRETQARDELDTGRADSPLRPDDDAWVIDTDGLDEGDVVELILQRVENLNNPQRAENLNNPLTVFPAQAGNQPGTGGDATAPTVFPAQAGNQSGVEGSGPWA